MSISVPEVAAAELDFAALLRAGDMVAIGQGSAEPLALTRALGEQADALPRISAFVGLSYSGSFDVEFAERVPLVSYGALADLAPVAAAGLLEVVPCHYSQLPQLMHEGPHAASVALVQLSPADADGMHSLGTSIDHAGEAIAGARLVIAEVNERMPVPAGAVRIPASAVDVAVATSRPLITLEGSEPSDRDRLLAAYVAGLVPAGAAIQLGFGGTATAIGRLLCEGGQRLRVHSALVGDWALEFARQGVLDAAAEPPIVTGAALGGEELYEFLGESELVRYDGIEALQSPAALARVPGLVAINSGLQVDLAGNVNAELIGKRRVGALGGHTDFLRGAQASEGGASIVVLPASTGRGGSRIVPAVDAVTTSGSFVDYVVTEHGVAALRGRTVSERATAIAAIAGPDFRDELGAG